MFNAACLVHSIMQKPSAKHKQESMIECSKTLLFTILYLKQVGFQPDLLNFHVIVKLVTHSY